MNYFISHEISTDHGGDCATSIHASSLNQGDRGGSHPYQSPQPKSVVPIRGECKDDK